jgi:autotransporter-associated beta strand protein
MTFEDGGMSTTAGGGHHSTTSRWARVSVVASSMVIAILNSGVIALLGAPGTASALDVIGYTAAANDRFASGYPTAPVTNTNPAFVGIDYSWLGVGWAASDPTKSFGFLSPQHYLVATHYGGSPTIKFLDAQGLVSSATEASVTNTGYGFTNSGAQPPDISIGELTAPIPSSSGLPRYGVLDINASSTTNSSYNGQPLLVYGRGPSGTQSTRIGAATINGTTLSGSDSYITTITTTASGVLLQVGDSGSPDFIPWTNPNGAKELTIIGNNAATASGTFNVMNAIGNSAVMAAINALTTPDGYALKVVGNPSNTWVGSSSTLIGNRGAWGLSPPAPLPNDKYVLFDGATAGGGRAVTVDTAANERGMYFKSTGSGTSGFTFSGASTLTVGRGGITNYDTSRQTISSPIALGSHQYWDAGAGGITANAIATGTAGYLLEIAGSGTARITGDVSGSGGLAASGHRLELSGSSSYTGRTWVHTGTLVVGGTIGSSSGVSLAAGGVLAGTGRVPAIAGAGAVDPGNSPGILTGPSVDPSAGLDFNFEFTQTGSPTWGTGTASGNDVLRLTSGSTPFATALAAANGVNVFLDVATLSLNDVFRGGFFTDLDAAFLGSVQNASWNYYLATPGGATTYNGVAYSLYGGPYSVALATVAETAAFSGGSEAGYVTQFTVVPEPMMGATLALAVAAFAACWRRRGGWPG